MSDNSMNLYEVEYYTYHHGALNAFTALHLKYVIAISFDDVVEILKAIEEFHEIKSIKLLSEEFDPLTK